MIKIQLSNPEIISVNKSEFINLEDAIECIFPLDTEHLFLIWNNIFIPLTYKYDISLMVFDFIKILDFIKDNQVSGLEIHWVSNTFASIWRIKKNNSFLTINSEWKVVNGKVEKILNNSNENIVDTY
jgi:hypothetical protein